jgi:hypothetical protein
MKARDWIDRVKAVKGLPSDYAAANLLGLSRCAVSGYRNKPEATFDVAVSASVAKVLGISLIGIIIDQAAERSKCDATRSLLFAESARLCKLGKVKPAIKSVATSARKSRAAAHFH